jgi:hypothetical protein
MDSEDEMQQLSTMFEQTLRLRHGNELRNSGGAVVQQRLRAALNWKLENGPQFEPANDPPI